MAANTPRPTRAATTDDLPSCDGPSHRGRLKFTHATAGKWVVLLGPADARMAMRVPTGARRRQRGVTLRLKDGRE